MFTMPPNFKKVPCFTGKHEYSFFRDDEWIGDADIFIPDGELELDDEEWTIFIRQPSKTFISPSGKTSNIIYNKTIFANVSLVYTPKKEVNSIIYCSDFFTKFKNCLIYFNDTSPSRKMLFLYTLDEQNRVYCRCLSDTIKQ